MRFAAYYSETLEVFFLMPTDGISDHLYASQSVVTEMATVQERALCVGWLFFFFNSLISNPNYSDSIS
jgi:hypothetical protein